MSSGTSASAAGCSFKLEFLQRQGSHEFIVTPDAAAGELRLSSTGTSRYRELEATTRYLGGERRDITVSYVWAKGTADLNNYDQFFGNLRNPIIRANENNLIPTDVRHRLLVRGTHRAAGRVGFRAAAGAPIGVSVVGGGRVPGLRRAAQPHRTPARGSHARFHARAAVAVQEVPLPRRPEAVQRLRRVGRHGTCRTT